MENGGVALCTSQNSATATALRRRDFGTGRGEAIPEARWLRWERPAKKNSLNQLRGDRIRVALKRVRIAVMSSPPFSKGICRYQFLYLSLLNRADFSDRRLWCPARSLILVRTRISFDPHLPVWPAPLDPDPAAPASPPAAPPLSRRERQRVWQRRYRARQRGGAMTMPVIGADEISFLIETRRARRPRSVGDRMRHCACGYSKLTRKLRTRRLSSKLNLSSSGPTEAGSKVLTPEDFRQLAERCALLAVNCATPGVAEELRTLALDYLTRAVSPIAKRKQQR
jgi:hypothetical protein